MKWLHFILSHSIFIAFCAVALCFQTALLLHINLTIYLYFFIFFSTLCSYNFYWLLSGYSFAGATMNTFIKKHYSNLIVFLLAAAGMSFTLLKIPKLLPVVSAGIVLTLLYAVPLLPFKIFHLARKAGLLKTILLAFTWAFVTVYIPYKEAPIGNFNTLVLLFNARFLFMLMLCIIFDARDTKVDKIRGLQTLTTILKPSTVQYIMLTVFILFIINGIVLRLYYHEMIQIGALAVNAILGLTIYYFSLKKQGYFFYYFLVDGLMLFSSITIYIASLL